jgi:hypothetical protein
LARIDSQNSFIKAKVINLRYHSIYSTETRDDAMAIPIDQEKLNAPVSVAELTRRKLKGSLSQMGLELTQNQVGEVLKLAIGYALTNMADDVAANNTADDLAAKNPGKTIKEILNDTLLERVATRFEYKAPPSNPSPATHLQPSRRLANP